MSSAVLSCATRHCNGWPCCIAALLSSSSGSVLEKRSRRLKLSSGERKRNRIRYRHWRRAGNIRRHGEPQKQHKKMWKIEGTRKRKEPNKPIIFSNNKTKAPYLTKAPTWPPRGPGEKPRRIEPHFRIDEEEKVVQNWRTRQHRENNKTR